MHVVVNHSLCTGCRLCQLSCSLSLFGENNPKKSALAIRSNLLEDGHYRVTVCAQCGVCAELCPAGAVTAVDGAYRVNAEECVWCGICTDECPHGAMVTIKDRPSPIKCTACGDCVEICPTGALAMVE